MGFEALNLNHDVSTADRLVPTLKFLKIDPRLRGYLSVSVDSYAHQQHVKVLKHFACLSYGYVEYTPCPWGFEPPSWHYIITQAHVYPQIPSIQPLSALMV